MHYNVYALYNVCGEMVPFVRALFNCKYHSMVLDVSCNIKLFYVADALGFIYFITLTFGNLPVATISNCFFFFFF